MFTLRTFKQTNNNNNKTFTEEPHGLGGCHIQIVRWTMV